MTELSTPYHKALVAVLASRMPAGRHGIWRDKGLRMRVAINLSALQMRQEDLLQRIAVAEGVENQRQQQILVEMGCDEMQGFPFAKPMSARSLLLWAMDDRSDTAAAFRASLFVETAVVGQR